MTSYPDQPKRSQGSLPMQRGKFDVVKGSGLGLGKPPKVLQLVDPFASASSLDVDLNMSRVTNRNKQGT